MRAGGLAIALLLAAALAGCLGDDGASPASESEPATPTREADPGDDSETADEAIVPTDHPYPDGDEGWPVDLEGPFELSQVITDPVESHDGAMLETTIYVPELPDGIKAPVVLWSLPYTGQCYWNLAISCMEASDSETIYEGGYSRLDPSVLVEAGFAVAISNVRGTGESGGCFENKGINEQLDQVALVEHLAEQPWSNGHVAMYGHSYHGATPWMAAVNAPEALKTIIASGVITDPYTFYHTPQGASSAVIGGPWAAGFTGSLTLFPPLGGTPPPADDASMRTTGHAERLPERACPELVDVMTEVGKGQFTDQRAGGFWDERRLTTRLPDVTASVLLSQGFRDQAFGLGHAYQDDDVWKSLPATTPKRMILGQWGHDLPPPTEYLENAPFGADWYEDTAIPWLAYWLKGIGDPEEIHIGTVHHQDDALTWHQTSSWPPAEVRHEVLYLAEDGTLPTEPSEGSRTFLSAGATLTLCAGVSSETTWPVYLTEPLDQPVTLAGNPWAYLQLESTAPGGLVTVVLARASPDQPCPSGDPSIEDLSVGAADLRFHEGNYQGQDFPVLDPTPVRVDLYNGAQRFEAGDQVIVLVGPGINRGAYASQPWAPAITIHGGDGPEASHIVLPIIEGTLGGAAPTLDYPPQPFLPEGVE